MAVAMSVTPVSYAYAEDSAVAGVENTESGQQTVEVTDGKIGAADAAGQPAEEVTGQEEETTAMKSARNCFEFLFIIQLFLLMS